ncbi:MAG TPA: AraC family transcriptional regulator [Bryobacteraceae bacterium]|nr:AraC family transcriptional regulator [Bryobacteraceae bacterium]
MAKIAVELERALTRRALCGAAGQATARRLAQGDGWTVQDVVCTSGPQDRPFEELHSGFSIAIVVAGSFQYRSTTGHELMTPGSLLLGNAGQCFECGHEHGWGDRCVSFYYAPDYFERLAADSGVRGPRPDFRTHRLPPLRALSPLIARACAALSMDGPADGAWEELSVQLAARTVQLVRGLSSPPNVAPPSAVARVTRAVRAVERHPDAGLTLARLARESGLSPYHFLRTFERLTGLTPHQYVLRARLREAAIRLAVTEKRARILDIALDSGFGDVSNFNRSFRAEFGVSPRAYRQRASE